MLPWVAGSGQNGKTLPVLFNEPVRDGWRGLSDNYLPVEIKSKENLLGKIREVRISQRTGLVLKGIT